MATLLPDIVNTLTLPSTPTRASKLQDISSASESETSGTVHLEASRGIQDVVGLQSPSRIDKGTETHDQTKNGTPPTVFRNRVSDLLIEQRIVQSSGRRAQHPSFKWSPTPQSRCVTSPSKHRGRLNEIDRSWTRSPTKKKKRAGRLKLVPLDELRAQITNNGKSSSSIQSGTCRSSVSNRVMKVLILAASTVIPEPMTSAAVSRGENRHPANDSSLIHSLKQKEEKGAISIDIGFDSDDIFQDDSVPVKPVLEPLNQLRGQAPIQKRRNISGPLPNEKRIKSPTKIPATTPSRRQASLENGASALVAGPQSVPQRPSHEGSHSMDTKIVSSASEDDGHGELVRLILPGDSPLGGGIRRQEPVDRRHTTSPRALVRLFAAAKELTIRANEEAAAVMGRHSHGSIFAIPSSLSEVNSPMGQVSGSRPSPGFVGPTDRSVEGSDTGIVSGKLFGVSDDLHFKSHGCIPSRAKSSANQRPVSSGGRSSNSEGSGIRREVGFIGGHKLMMAGRRRDSESGSDKERQHPSRAEPSSRTSPPAPQQDEERDDDSEVVRVPQSTQGSTQALRVDGSGDQTSFSKDEHTSSNTEVVGKVEPTQGSNLDTLKVDEKVLEGSASRPGTADTNLGASIATGDSGSPIKLSSSVSGTIEPVTPADDMRPSSSSSSHIGDQPAAKKRDAGETVANLPVA